MIPEILGEQGWKIYWWASGSCPDVEMNVASTRRNWPIGGGSSAARVPGAETIQCIRTWLTTTIRWTAAEVTGRG